MRRLVVVVGAALVLAPAAAADLPVHSQGSSIGEGVPLKAYASVQPTVHLFGDELTAKLAIVADTKWVDTSRLRVRTDFAPYRPIADPSVLSVRTGRFEQVTWTWTLRCVTSPCVPRSPPSDTAHVFHFHQAHVDYLTLKGRRAYGISANFPPVEVVSQVSPGVLAFLARTNHLNWRITLTPVAKPAYRIAPGLLFWIVVALGGAALLVAGFLLVRWYRVIRPRAAPVVIEPGTPLERALDVLRYAHRHGDETLQRKAFERVAGELGVARADELTQIARELAWSQRTPEDEEVEEFAEQAREAQEERA